jgi:AcrR family transcriptional regulator
VTEPVKRRTYDAVARRANSAATRQRILDAARALFIDQGYRVTTIAAIAAGADVNADTVYELVGRKPMLLRELIEQSLSGASHPVEAEQRAHIIAMRAEPDPVTKLAIYASATRETHQRLAPLFLALRDASSTDDDAAKVWRDISDRRATNMRKLVADVRHADHSRYQLLIDKAADVAWALNSPEMYVMLTDDRGWSPHDYERFLADSLHRLLLGEQPGDDEPAGT